MSSCAGVLSALPSLMIELRKFELSCLMKLGPSVPGVASSWLSLLRDCATFCRPSTTFWYCRGSLPLCWLVGSSRLLGSELPEASIAMKASWAASRACSFRVLLCCLGCLNCSRTCELSTGARAPFFSAWDSSSFSLSTS